jgi:hypothetical protein
MRFVPRSYFCTCWNVTPSTSPSSVWLKPRCSRSARTRFAISVSDGSRLRFPICFRTTFQSSGAHPPAAATRSHAAVADPMCVSMIGPRSRRPDRIGDPCARLD